ncbi:isochorismate synthase MenF [Leptolyngbya sp. FACHB-261]|uniref:isochorismate synthase n=1 Tax=Leptolyngbya sp. FACHB-261 TaxID=2692806 RepID=UPI00168439D3|nr:isochorismate synthase [Leptolyngbya sp. FACHB-261]MBD2099372.1 isochorismate synthase [Leptolyngbya sp. FACHB-261]
MNSCQRLAVDKQHAQIVSISSTIQPVDPLAVIASFRRPRKRYFYFGRQCTQETVVGIDTALNFTGQGRKRFLVAKELVHLALANIIKVGDLDLPFAGPHFFCQFTFFDEGIEPGFPFSPASVFLPRWQVARSQEQSVAVANLVVDWKTDIELLAQEVWQVYQKLLLLSRTGIAATSSGETISTKKREFSLQPQIERSTIDTAAFKSMVVSASQAIRDHEFEKIVLAHTIDINALKSFEPLASIQQLRQQYPYCYVFCTHNGMGQSFIGASPERLAKVQHQQLSTEALAGSAPRGKTAAEDAYCAQSLLSSAKDLREHQIVVEAIVSRLLQLSMQPKFSIQPNLLQLPNIQHLHTSISAKIPEGLSLFDILAKLHPTPAVGGEPQEIAYQKIRDYENFERGLYAGPIGWIDDQGNGEFAVAIRSALLNGYHARLYAGTGIVADSNADKEAEEIKLKFQPLLDALTGVAEPSKVPDL